MWNNNNVWNKPFVGSQLGHRTCEKTSNNYYKLTFGVRGLIWSNSGEIGCLKI